MACVWFGRLPFPPGALPFAELFLAEALLDEPFFDEPFFAEPVLDGGVNGRNPSFEFALFPAVDPTRASLGDIVGAWYSPPAARADTADRPLKSPALAVAATAGRP